MRTAGAAGVAVPLGAGALTSVLLGVYGAAHDPTGRTFTVLGFEEVDTWKNGLTTVVVVLFVVQLFLGLRIAGRFGPARPAPPWLTDIHRIVGTLAFGASLPVAFHCLWALGYRSTEPRVLVHSLLGLSVYGLYCTKVVAVRRDDSPAWVVPGAGVALAAAMLALWWTSALTHYLS